MRAASSAREFILALTQVLVVCTAIGVVALLVVFQRWRRLGLVLLAAAAGAGCASLLDSVLDLPGRLPDAVSSGTWLASTRFPNLAVLGAAAAAATVGKPWLSRPWTRATNVALATLLVAMALAGTAGVPELLLALAVGATAGALLLVVFGSPNRRPSPAAVGAALRSVGVEVEALALERALGGRSQLYRAETSTGRKLFVKVYSSDSRDADLLYRGYRALRAARSQRRPAVVVARGRRAPRGVPPRPQRDRWRARPSLGRDGEHAGRIGPRWRWTTSAGRRSTNWTRGRSTPSCWRRCGARSR